VRARDARARDARRVRVRVIRFVPLGFPSHTKKNPIKTITYQLIWGNVKKVIDRVTVPASIGTSKRRTPNQTCYG
jgi:hypothetical protein